MNAAIRIRDTVINLNNMCAAQFGMVPAPGGASETPGVVVYYIIPGTTTAFNCKDEKEARGILKQIEDALLS